MNCHFFVIARSLCVGPRGNLPIGVLVKPLLYALEHIVIERHLAGYQKAAGRKQRAEVFEPVLHGGSELILFGAGQRMAYQLYFGLGTLTPQRNEIAADGFKQQSIAKCAAEFACRIELVDRVWAEEYAEGAVRTKAGDDVLAGFGCDLDSFDERSRFGEQIFTAGFVAGHGIFR
jgi:hypothetical protein